MTTSSPTTPALAGKIGKPPSPPGYRATSGFSKGGMGGFETYFLSNSKKRTTFSRMGNHSNKRAEAQGFLRYRIREQVSHREYEMLTWPGIWYNYIREAYSR
jgi:hypothetical protein